MDNKVEKVVEVATAEKKEESVGVSAVFLRHLKFIATSVAG